MALIKNILFNKWLVLFIRLMLASIFVVSGILKIIEPMAFSDAISSYKILPISLSNLFAIILPWVELLAGLSLLTKQYLLSASILIMLLSLIFVLAVGSAMLRGLDINCGCFSINISEKAGAGIIMRDIGIIITAYIIFASEMKQALTKHRIE